jgi:hypothetical protein
MIIFAFLLNGKINWKESFFALQINKEESRFVESLSLSLFQFQFNYRKGNGSK